MSSNKTLATQPIALSRGFYWNQNSAFSEWTCYKYDLFLPIKAVLQKFMHLFGFKFLESLYLKYLEVLSFQQIKQQFAYASSISISGTQFFSVAN